MDDIRLRMISLKSRTTAVPDIFIDEYMAGADGEFVKVYLYLLRSLTRSDSSFSVGDMADMLGHTERDIKRALKFWEKKGLVRLEFDERHDLTGISMVDLSGGTVSAPEDDELSVEIKEPEIKRAAPQHQQEHAAAVSPSRVEEALSGEEELLEVMKCTEIYIGRPLSQPETQRFYSWHHELSMSPALISYLVESCIDAGHADFSYMNAVALKWSEKGYTTPEEAESGGRVYSSAMKTVAKAFGIAFRPLAPAECEFVERWSRDYDFDDTLISEACRRTILSAGKPSFPYAERILNAWHDAGLTTLEAVEESERKRAVARPVKPDIVLKKKKSNISNFSERKYDFNAIEAKLLNNN